MSSGGTSHCAQCGQGVTFVLGKGWEHDNGDASHVVRVGRGGVPRNVSLEEFLAKVRGSVEAVEGVPNTSAVRESYDDAPPIEKMQAIGACLWHYRGKHV